MKLVSLNVGLFEKNNEKLVEFLEQTSPDIFCGQEVTRRVDPRAVGEFVSLETCMKRFEYKNSFFAPDWALDYFEKNNFHGQEHFYYDFGGTLELGQLTASNLPLTSAKAHYVCGEFGYTKDWSKWPQDDTRLFSVSEYEVSGKSLVIINYHGVWTRRKEDSPKALAAVKMLMEEAGKHKTVIICGDFNLFPETQAMKLLSDKYDSLVDKFEIMTTRPDSNELSGRVRNVVDYVLVSNRVQVNDFKVLESDASDHLPLVMDFELNS